MPVPPVWRGPRGEGTYEVGAGENLASAQYLLLRWLIGVLRLDETGRAARILAVLQRRGVTVTFVNAVQRATPHTPVEVVHALPLQEEQEKANKSEADERCTERWMNFTERLWYKFKMTTWNTVQYAQPQSTVGLRKMENNTTMLYILIGMKINHLCIHVFRYTIGKTNLC